MKNIYKILFNKKYIIIFSIILSFVFVTGFSLSSLFKSKRSKKKKENALYCFDCHRDKKEKFSSGKIIHSPVKNEQCLDCHKRHGVFARLILTEPAERLCFKCHGASSDTYQHLPYKKGYCLKCHNFHISENENLLNKDKNNLCIICHNNYKEEKASTNPHNFNNNCMICHRPHSSKNANLLINQENELCAKCYKNKKIIEEKHSNYPVFNKKCSDCHNVHKQNNNKFLKNKVHMPVEEKMCNLCHNESQSAQPFKLNAEIKDICINCHSDIEDNFKNKNIHTPYKNYQCLSCHKPHTFFI